MLPPGGGGRCAAAGAGGARVSVPAMPDASYLAATRASYDVMAADYAARFGGDRYGSDLGDLPLERAMLGVFADLVRAAGGGPVADVGCGPGRVTALLADLGLDAFGVDLSPGMITLARRTFPELRFEVGSMLALDLADGSLGGLLAYYSIIHIPRPERPRALAEFARVLAPGAPLMLGFQIGDEHAHRDEAWGRAIDLYWYRQQPADLAGLLADAGFETWTTVVKEPEGEEKTQQGIMLARKRADQSSR
jgi:ubiquinone/menaquinone biosynthesis C-methylase UbiE